MGRDNVIYMDQDGFDEYMEEIKLLEEKLREENMGRKRELEAVGTKSYSPESHCAGNESYRLTCEIQRKKKVIKNVVILKPGENSNIVDINDVVDIELNSNGKTSDMLIKLVGTAPNFRNEIKEITVNSPIGAAIYKKEVGDTCSYEVMGKTSFVYIKSKVDVNKLEKGNQKVKK